jgi:hypothetical protein
VAKGVDHGGGSAHAEPATGPSEVAHVATLLAAPRRVLDYHKRNAETAFSCIKRKFSAAVHSETYTAQVNEVLCKVLCYNLSVLTHSITS